MSCDLIQIPLNCEKLSSLECRLQLYPDYEIQVLENFKQLKRLDLELRIPENYTNFLLKFYNQDQESKFYTYEESIYRKECLGEVKGVFDFMLYTMFRGILPDLTDLRIRLPTGHSSEDLFLIKENFLEEIDTNLPNLKHLSINRRINLSEWGVNILSRLTKLETIRIKVINDPSIREQLINNLIKNCKNIKVMDIC